jgi:hypothetical protein
VLASPHTATSVQVPLDAQLAAPGRHSGTPSATSTPSASVRSSSSPAPSGRAAPSHALPEGAVLPPPHSLGAFAATHTTEDQASLEQIFADEAVRRRARNAWVFSESERTNAQAHPVSERPLALPSPTDGFGTSGCGPSTLIGWHHTPQSALYYPPEGSRALSAAERALMPTGAAPETFARNTRFRAADADTGGTVGGGSMASPSTVPSTELSPASSLHLERGTTPGRIPEGVPQMGNLRGYSVVATPSPSPGMVGEPIMTWGEVAATPVLLDGGDREEGWGHGGKPFLGAERSRQDTAARQVSRTLACQRVQKRRHSGGHRGCGFICCASLEWVPALWLGVHVVVVAHLSRSHLVS